jgi:hypothetical protein
MGKRGTTFCENAEPVSTISIPYERGTRFTVQVGYDFQRDKATNTHFKDYVNAANYAVGVYMAGVGYGKWESVKIAQTYGFLFSSKKYDDNARDWTEKGWDDADQGKWQ